MRFIKRWMVVGFIATGMFLVWLLVGFGLGSNFLIRSKISSLGGEIKENAIREFYVQDKPDYVFAGTIARVNLRNGGGVWMWSNLGLRYFQSDQYTSYSYYDVCATMVNAEKDGVKNIDSNTRETTMDIREWIEWISIGSFAQLIIATPERGGKEGNLREIHAYDLPLFLPIEIGVMCEN